MNQWHRRAIACALMPLIVGTAIFLFWYVTREEWLTEAGITCIGVGTALFVIGVFCLFMAVRRAHKAHIPHWRQTMGTLALLVVNFPLAALYTFFVVTLATNFSVTVVNRNSKPIEQVTLTDPARGQFVIRNIAPNHQKLRQFALKGEGEASFMLEAEGLKREGVAFGYISSGFTEYNVTITLEYDGSVSVRESSH